MNSVTMKAYGKVNLALDVIRRREDGYHEVRMIMQNLDIYDELIFTVESGKSGLITIEANRDNVPTDGSNLIAKAIRLMSEEYKLKSDIHVVLNKNIPVEAGMAGGSTDCAAALMAMNMLFELGLDEKRLMELGVRLGADVPFCIMGRTALSEGIGELLTPVAPLTGCSVLVVKPPFGVSTAAAYRGLNLEKLESHPDIDGMLKALEDEDLKGVATRMENVLETVSIPMHPEIELIKNAIKEQGALNALMSGSGPTVFGLFESDETANKAKEELKKLGIAGNIFVTKPV
ncbi:MAG: 4-(cytidine 5'-diphospho)-2-C-methyl-D-erythritol kinase [Wujia sp.]